MASLIERQTESRKKRALQLELAKMDMEIKRKEFEYNQRIELAHIEMENEVVAARDNTELAELEARIAEQEVSELTKHKEKDKESNRTCSSSLISSSSNSYQERNSAHPATADHILPIGQSNVPKETSPLKDNPNANRATSILHEGIKQTHQFPTDAPGHPESLRYLPPAQNPSVSQQVQPEQKMRVM